MKTATIPSVRVEPEFRAEVESVLVEGETLSEFVYDLRHPNHAFMNRTRPPLIERHPVLFWKGVSTILAAIILVLLFVRFGTR